MAMRYLPQTSTRLLSRPKIIKKGISIGGRRMDDEQIKRMIVENRDNEEDLFADIKELVRDVIIYELKRVVSHNNSEYTSDYLEDRLAELQESEGRDDGSNF